MPRPPSVTATATLRRIRLLAIDLTRELACQRSASNAAIDMTAAIYQAADAALAARKPAKRSKR